MTGQGIVISVQGDKAHVRVTSRPECSACISHSHCFTGSSNCQVIVVVNDCGAGVSDQIVFETHPSRVILSAVVLFLMPIVVMIIGYSIALFFHLSRVWSLVVTFLSFAGFFIILRFIDIRLSGGQAFYPRIIRSESALEHTCNIQNDGAGK
jgi:positive regulator of sigma E activity